jgi:hypothetical protein
LNDKYAADSAAATRFVAEAKITSQLQHPGIPAVHELGELPDGRPFLAMKLVKGRTLQDLLREPAGPRPRAWPLHRHLRAGLPCGRLCPCSPRHSPRPQASQRHGGCARRGAGDGLGSGQGARSEPQA